VLLAVPSDQLCLKPSLLSGERTVMSSANNAYPCFPQAIELMEKGLVKAGPIITHEYPFEEAIEAFSIADSKTQNEAIKVILKR